MQIAPASLSINMLVSTPTLWLAGISPINLAANGKSGAYDADGRGRKSPETRFNLLVQIINMQSIEAFDITPPQYDPIQILECVL